MKKICKIILICITAVMNMPASADTRLVAAADPARAESGFDDLTWRYNTGLLAMADQDGKMSDDVKSSTGLNWHKIFGWSTIASAAATMITGAAEGEDMHCGLAGLSTGLAALTCINGFYKYHDIVGFTDGDTLYTAHASMGLLAAGGFAAALALADSESHAAVGSVSGIVFTLAVGIVYF